MAAFERIIWIVLDSVGIGELPDAALRPNDPASRNRRAAGTRTAGRAARDLNQDP